MPAIVTVPDTGSYAARVDMFACIHPSKPLPVQTVTPDERREAGEKGLTIRRFMLYISEVLGPAVAELGEASYVLILDNATIHNEAKIKVAFSEAGVEIQQVLYLPTISAKRLSPLDNALFHDWKQAVRKHSPLSIESLPDIMAQEWDQISQSLIQAHFKHCGLTRDCDVYFDCPNPQVHRH